MNVVVDIADLKISDNIEDQIVTYSLGSCIGITIYDTRNKIGGMIHCMLPLSRIDPQKAQKNPYMFTDTGLSSFLQQLFNRGSRKADLIIKIAGCSRILDEKGLFNIGERNHTVARKILWKNDILIKAEDVGGSKSRTIFLDIATGITRMKSGGVTVEL